MEVNKLIEIAKRCGTGVCHPDCEYHKEFCMESMMTELASRLEKATNTIPVGNGQDYEVVQE